MEISTINLNSKNLVTSFSSFITNLETETKTLRTISNLRQAMESNPELLSQLMLFSETVTNVENSMDSFEEHIDSELKQLEETDIFNEDITEQTNYINYLSNLVQTSQLSQKGCKESINLITTEEFENISKTTRNRLTLLQVEDALESIIQFIAVKTKVVYISYYCAI